MRIGKTHALDCEGIHPGGLDFRIRIQTGDITIAQVIRHNEDDIRL
jgi:hypothetical protein